MRTILVLTTALALAGCGAGGGHGAAAAPAVVPPAEPAHGTSTSLRITIPPKTTSAASRGRRLPRYVSPATQSVAISFVPSSGPALKYNQNLTPASNPGCTASLISPTVCTVTLGVPPGTYTANFATYDGLLDGSSNPTGNKLSANQNFPVTISAGQANTINVTFQGVPITVAFLPSVTSALRGSMLGGYTLSACAAGSHAVTVLGIDADTNYILGPGAPVPALSATSGAPAVSIAAPPASAPNTFTFTTVSAGAGTAVTLAASVTPPTAPPNDSGGYAVHASIQLTYDANLCGAITEYTVPTTGSGPIGIVAGPDGTLWFAENSGQKIGSVTTSGTTFLEYPIPTQAFAITAGPDGALWFTGGSLSNTIGRMTTAGAFSSFTVPTSNSNPAGITTGPDANLWFTENFGNTIGSVTTGGTFAEYTIPTASSGAYYITAGPDGALWFAEQLGNKIGRVTTSGTFTEYTIPTAGSNPVGITTGPDGALWFTEVSANKIGRVTTSGTFTEFVVPTAGSSPISITTGPDGAMWFAEGSANKIGRVSVSGAFTEYTIPTAASGVSVITTGPDGALWFTERNVNKIGQLK